MPCKNRKIKALKGSKTSTSIINFNKQMFAVQKQRSYSENIESNHVMIPTQAEIDLKEAKALINSL